MSTSYLKILYSIKRNDENKAKLEIKLNQSFGTCLSQS